MMRRVEIQAPSGEIAAADMLLCENCGCNQWYVMSIQSGSNSGVTILSCVCCHFPHGSTLRKFA